MALQVWVERESTDLNTLLDQAFAPLSFLNGH
jgi:hypothetical protein